MGKDVYFNIVQKGMLVGKIKFKLFDQIVPKTAQNFRQLCKNDQGQGYKGSTFHKVIPQFMIQGGDFSKGEGTENKSIFRQKFQDQNILKHSKRGILSMENSGPNTNGSQFIITTAPCPHLDGKNVVIGQVIEGYQIVQFIEKHGPRENQPGRKIIIVSCGQVK